MLKTEKIIHSILKQSQFLETKTPEFEKLISKFVKQRDKWSGTIYKEVVSNFKGLPFTLSQSKKKWSGTDMCYTLVLKSKNVSYKESAELLKKCKDFLKKMKKRYKTVDGDVYDSEKWKGEEWFTYEYDFFVDEDFSPFEGLPSKYQWMDVKSMMKQLKKTYKALRLK